MSASTFVAQYPEFDSVFSSHPTMVQAALDDAATEVDTTACGTESDKAQGLIAADTLARKPFGQQAALVDDEGRTPYQINLERLRQRIGLGYRTVLE